MARGGARQGAGRPAMAKNVIDREAREKAHASGQTPLDFLLEVMRDGTSEKHQRIDAAKAAAPYMHARLNAVELSGSVGVTHEQWLEQLG